VDAGERRYRERYCRGERLLAERRHQAFKLKIGARELATDLRHTRAIVEALGDRASIRVDVNQAGTPPRERLPRAGGDGRRSD
jgi:L-alanine-DL-glutamate epimerase-like enolase superfamily enzyme